MPRALRECHSFDERGLCGSLGLFRRVSAGLRNTLPRSSIEIPTSRPQITIDSDPADILRLSGYMLSRIADSVKAGAENGVVQINIHFEH
jgi:hypothetical protein